METNQKLMQTVYNRYSPDRLKNYREVNALSNEIDFELNDISRYPAILQTHFNTSAVSSAYQMISLILLTEGSDGKS